MTIIRSRSGGEWGVWACRLPSLPRRKSMVRLDLRRSFRNRSETVGKITIPIIFVFSPPPAWMHRPPIQLFTSPPFQLSFLGNLVNGCTV